MRRFTLSVSKVFQVRTNTHYPNVQEISSVQELADAMQYDHAEGLFRNNHRKNDNLIETTCLMMDIDNDDIDNPNDWMTPEKLSEKLSGVEFYINFSRNHMKEKDKKGKIISPRPRFHIYFPLDNAIKDYTLVRRYKQTLLMIIPAFDPKAADAARFFYAVKNPKIQHFDGDKDIVTFLDALPVEQQQISITAPVPVKKVTQPAPVAPVIPDNSAPVTDTNDKIPVGSRNGELYQRGIDLIPYYADNEKARQAFKKECEKCEEKLDDKELWQIWNHVLKSDAKKLAELARSIGDYNSFIAEAEKQYPNTPQGLIINVAKKVFAKPTHVDSAPAPEQKKPLSNEEVLGQVAIELLIKNRNVQKAESAYHEAVDNNDNFDSELIAQVWNEALTSAPVKLAKFAREFKDNEASYLALAEKITDNIELINKIWTRLNGKKKGNSESHEKKEKMPVNINSVIKALNDLGIVIRLNVITQEVEIDKLPENSQYVDPKFHELPEIEKKQAARKAIAGVILPYLRDNYYYCNVGEVENYLEQIAAHNRYNPLEELFKSKPHDGKDRINELCKLMHIEHDKYYCMLLKKWLIQSVAMALNDKGEFNNEFIFTLYGKQGVGKTTLFRLLAMMYEWFCEGLDLNLQDKDSFMKALRAWIVELGELDATLKHQQSSLKAFVTEKFATYRVWYGRNLVTLPKRCSLCATVNKLNFLKDIEGGTRRFGIIEVTNIEYKKLAQLPRDWYVQLWTQAYQLFLTNHASYRLAPEERAEQELRNSNFTEFVRGEVEIYEHLNFDALPCTWKWINASNFLAQAELDKAFSAKDIREALDKIANKDKRIIVKQYRKGQKYYLLPPVWSKTELANENFADTYGLTEFLENEKESTEPPISEQTPPPEVIQTPEPDATPHLQIPEVTPEAEIQEAINDCISFYSPEIITNTVKKFVALNLQNYTIEELSAQLTFNDATALEFILEKLGRKDEEKIAKNIANINQKKTA